MGVQPLLTMTPPFAATVTLTGNAQAAISASTGGTLFVDSSYSMSCTGTPAFSNAFAAASGCGNVVVVTASVSGSATGVRYAASSNGVINTNAQAGFNFPGSSAGTLASGGQYV